MWTPKRLGVYVDMNPVSRVVLNSRTATFMQALEECTVHPAVHRAPKSVFFMIDSPEVYDGQIKDTSGKPSLGCDDASSLLRQNHCKWWWFTINRCQLACVVLLRLTYLRYTRSEDTSFLGHGGVRHDPTWVLCKTYVSWDIWFLGNGGVCLEASCL